MVLEVTSADEFAQLLQKGPGLVVVDFTATWCGPCKRLAPLFEQWAEEYKDRPVTLAKLDVDKVSEVAASQGVTAMPTVKLYRFGECVRSFRGLDPNGMQQAIEQLSALPIESAATSAENKQLGAAAIKAGDPMLAARLFYERAIEQAPEDHTLYSNRSAAYASLGRWTEALADGEAAVRCKADWPRGHQRVGAALAGLGRMDEARAAYERGLALDPQNDALKRGLEQLSSGGDAGAQAAAGGSGDGGGMDTEKVMKLQTMMMDLLKSDLTPILKQVPEVSGYLDESDFVAKLAEVRKDPQAALQRHMGDPRMSAVVQVVAALAQQSLDPAAAEAKAKAMAEAEEREREARRAREAAEREAAERAELEKLTPEQRAAKEHRDAGNAAYKKRQFDEAIGHYDRALQEDPDDIAARCNRAAVHLSAGRFEECMSDADEALERGRKTFASFQLLAKALLRRGKALVKLDRLEEAVEAFRQSELECRTKEALQAREAAERELRKRAEEAYRDRDLSLAAKEQGTAAFKEARYPDAVDHFSEAIRRWPDDPSLYGNRAAAYTKLGALDDAVRDCDRALALDERYVRGYVRKGLALRMQRVYKQAMDAYERGLSIEPDNRELLEGLQATIAAINGGGGGAGGGGGGAGGGQQGGQPEDEQAEAQRRERAMADPEIQAILQDPIMQNVLRAFQENPVQAQEYLRDATIASRLEKLVAAGIVGVRRG